MITKRKILSVLLVLALIVSPILPPAQTTVLAGSIQELTIENRTLYEALKKCLTDYKDSDNKGALQDSDDERQWLKLDLDKVTLVQMILESNITGNNFKNTLETLFRGCTNLKYLRLRRCDLREIDCSILNNRESLLSLSFVECKMDKIPELTLPNLETLCLSGNNLSANGACDSLTKTKLPSLINLWLDDCSISNIDFIQNLGKLKNLSLADNSLTDDSILTLTGMANLSDLEVLNLGVRVHVVLGGTYNYNIYTPSKNVFMDPTGLASLPVYFPKLRELELSGLRITSIQAFTSIKNTPKIFLQMNNIADYTGLTNDNNFSLSSQRINLGIDFTVGQEIEIPELVKRILDPEDILYSSTGLTYTNCHLSDDETKIVMENTSASVKINSGKLGDSNINFKKKQTPSYTVPKNLTATVGDTLASVVLPEGFSWKESEQTLDEVGSHTFKAVYTPADTDKYFIVDNINIQVTVSAKSTPTLQPTLSPEPTQTPEPSPTLQPTLSPKPTLIPEPSPTLQPALSPEPTQTPEPSPTLQPTLSPKPTQTPKPSPTSKPTQTPEIPAPTAEVPTPTPPVMTPTPKPDESNLTGNQIEKRTDLPITLAVGKQKGKNGIKLTWNKWSGCSGYEVYWSYCDGKQNFQKLKTVKKDGKRVCIHKNLKTTRAYKYYIATYQIKDGRKNYLSKSSVIHVAMKQEKHTNVKKIKLNKTKLVLKSKQTFQMKVTAIKENKKKKLLDHERILRYYSGNKAVATVTKNGKIKAKKQGTCTIFVIANNGVANTIKLTVK